MLTSKRQVMEIRIKVAACFQEIFAVWDLVQSCGNWTVQNVLTGEKVVNTIFDQDYSDRGDNVAHPNSEGDTPQHINVRYTYPPFSVFLHGFGFNLRSLWVHCDNAGDSHPCQTPKATP